MKKAVIAIFLSAVLLLCACGNQEEEVIAAASASPTPTESTVTGQGGGSGQTAEPSGNETASPSAKASESSLYDPSIFVIEAKKTWQQELAPEYYANNECEIYLHKIDANDNRAVEGSYQGVFWMNTSLDTEGYIDEMFANIPGMEASFEAGGEAVCDNLGIFLNTEDDKAWVDYQILGEDGKPLPLTQDTPVAKGSFVAVAKDVYLEAHANGPQGESVDYSDEDSESEFTVNYVVHVNAGTLKSTGECDVVINLTGENFNVTMEGTMRTLPGYPEDVSDYLNSTEYQEAAQKHLQ